MGGGDNKDGAKPVEKSSLSLTVLCQYEEIPLQRARQLDCSLLVKIKAVAEQNEDRRAPVTLIATIDRSASMKDKLPLVQESLQFVVKQLRQDDKLAVITFDHEVDVVLPLTSMTGAGKVLADKAIKGIKERGHTNLSGGLLAALQMLYEVPPAESTLVESIVLFTDGKANFGIKDAVSLAKATSSMLVQINRPICVFTMGYGEDHDPDTLHAIADAGKGIFYYIENKDNIPDSFCDCLGGLLSVAAQNLVLTITANENSCTSIQRPQTGYATVSGDGQKCYKITIPDIYCEEEKSIPIHMTLPAISDSIVESKLQLIECSMSYFDVLQCAPSTLSTTGHVVVNKSINEPVTAAHYNEDIELHTLRYEVAEALNSATKLADKGELHSARDVLHRCKAKVKKSVIFGQPLAQYFVETIDESLEGLQTTVTYQSYGKPTLVTYCSSHSQQRSSKSLKSFSDEYYAHLSAKPMSVSPYSNTAKSNMKVTYAKIKFDKK